MGGTETVIAFYHGNGLHGNYRSFTAVKIPRENPRGKPCKFQYKPAYTEKCKPCLLCGIFKPRSSSDTTVTPQECDMSLLWMRGGGCGAHERCLGLRYRGTHRNTSSCTSREIEALLGQLVAKCTPHLRRLAGTESPLCRTGSHILPSPYITSKLPSHTRTLQVSGRTPLELWRIPTACQLP